MWWMMSRVAQVRQEEISNSDSSSFVRNRKRAMMTCYALKLRWLEPAGSSLYFTNR